jgi:hypothetical protein
VAATSLKSACCDSMAPTRRKVGVRVYIGVVPLLTGAVGFCPLDTVLGLNTCSVRR